MTSEIRRRGAFSPKSSIIPTKVRKETRTVMINTYIIMYTCIITVLVFTMRAEDIYVKQNTNRKYLLQKKKI